MANRKTNKEIAREVIAGKWGNGTVRRVSLRNAGYNYYTIQSIVNSMLAKQTKKSIEAIADEVIAGKWGNGNTRKKKLKSAGYDYSAVQKVVNEKLRKEVNNVAYVPRLYAPAYGDKLWVNVTYGGYNKCIVINKQNGEVIPNCTGYVHGRWMEIGGTTTEYNLSLRNASSYWSHNDGYARGQEPKLGACICFGNGAGHVAVVEQIISADEIVCSESDYGGPRFSVRHRYRQYGWKPAPSWGTKQFQGFIYHPALDDAGDGGADPGSGDPDKPVEPDPDEPEPDVPDLPEKPEQIKTSIYVISAMCGNMWIDSSLNPDIYLTGYGLPQITDTTAMEQWLAGYTYADTVSKAQGQMDYMLHEGIWTSKLASRMFSSLQDFLNSKSKDITMLTHAFNQGHDNFRRFDWDTRVENARRCYNYIIQHKGENPGWVESKNYLSFNQRLQNALMLFNICGDGGLGVPRGIPLNLKPWEMIRESRLSY